MMEYVNELPKGQPWIDGLKYVVFIGFSVSPE
jgi:hypothetical protein